MSIISSLCFVMIVAVYSIIADEPVCSQFSLFEKLLDKMIRIEHMIESTNAKMSKWEQIMEDNVKRLDVQKQSLNNDIEQKFNKVTSSLENFISKWNETLNNKLSDSNQKEEERNNSLTTLSESLQQDQTKQTERLDIVIDQLQKQIGTMSLNISNQQVFMENSVLKVTEKQATPTVLFQTSGVTDKTPSSGQTLIFKTIESNLHAGLDGGYSSNTGLFTAPVSGTYLFTVQLCVYPGRYFYGQIIAGGKIIAAVSYFEDGGIYYSCFSSSAVTTLSTGDTVYIKCTSTSSSGNILGESGNWWNMFSGVLIHTGTQ